METVFVCPAGPLQGRNHCGTNTRVISMSRFSPAVIWSLKSTRRATGPFPVKLYCRLSFVRNPTVISMCCFCIAVISSLQSTRRLTGPSAIKPYCRLRSSDGRTSKTKSLRDTHNGYINVLFLVYRMIYQMGLHGTCWDAHLVKHIFKRI